MNAKRRTALWPAALGVVAAATVLVFYASRKPEPLPSTDSHSATHSGNRNKTGRQGDVWSRSHNAGVIDESGSGAESTDKAAVNNVANTIVDRLSESFKFTTEQLADYFRRNGTNAESLLVAAQLGTNRTEFLKLAAQLHPHDPRVQFAVVAHDVFPEARREWLEKFKESAPDNALAGFLSARDYAKAGDRASAIRELVDSAGKRQFNDYTLDRWQTVEEAQLQAGRPVADAKASSGSGLLLPHLAQLKGLSIEMETWQKEYRAAGDTASAENLAQIGSTLARHLLDGEGSHFLINQLVGVAIERKMLSQLPPEAQPSFLPGTVQQRLDDLTRFRDDARQLSQAFNSVLNSADEAAIISYFDRMKMQGEYNALKHFTR